MIDLLVAMGIIALLSTIAIPYIRKYQPNLKLSATARDLTADLRYAQQLTVTEQKVYLVNFDAADDQYQILKIDIATSTIKSVSLDADVSFKEITGLADNKVVFNFYGGVSLPGQIVLANINDKTSTINIKPSGYVELAE